MSRLKKKPELRAYLE